MDIELSKYKPQALIDTSALKSNLSYLRKKIAPSKIFMVLKADANGHGLIKSAETAQKSGIHDFAVLLAEEALKIRKIETKGRIFTWQFDLEYSFDELISADIEVGVGTIEQLKAIASSVVRLQKKRLLVHLKLDTGLSRGGTRPENWQELLQFAKSLQDKHVIKVIGLWSHLSNTSLNDDIASLNIFLENTKNTPFSKKKLTLHIAASIASLSIPESRLDYVRIGLACFGYCKYSQDLKGVMTLVAPIIKLLPDSTMDSPMRAIVGCGFSHGISPSALGNEIIIHGYPARIMDIGPETSTVEIQAERIASKSFAINQIATDPLEKILKRAHHAIIFGSGYFSEATASQWADMCKTTTDDVLSRVKAERICVE